MAKLQILGPRRLLPDALRFLHGLGVLELRPAPAGEAAAVHPVPLAPAEAGEARALSEAVRRIEAVARALGASAGAAKRPYLGDRPTDTPVVPDPASPELGLRLDALDDEREKLAEERAALSRERALLDRYEKLLVALSPLRPSLHGATGPVETIGLVVRRGPLDALPLIEREVARLAGGRYDFQARAVDLLETGVLLTVPAEKAREVAALLFEKGVEKIELPAGWAGQPLVDALRRALRRRFELPAAIAALDDRLATLAARWCPALAATASAARNRLSRLDAQTRCGETEHAFVVRGWAPAAGLPALRARVAGALEGKVTVLDHPIAARELDRVPVVLRNHPALRPFELLLSLVPLPKYGSIDPTPLLAVFFPLLLGMVVGDVAFGLLALALALVARRREWGGALGRRVSSIAIACAASTIAFGVVYGEALGSLGESIGLRPLLFDRRSALVPSLALALGMGVVHLIVGMALGAWHAARAGHLRSALARGARLFIVAGVAPLAVAALLGRLPLPVAYGAAAAGGALVVLLLVTAGPMGLLELVLTAGNVLSYARLMALGLASVMMAEVANRVHAYVRPVALAVAIAVLVHAANFATALLGPTIAALRLHYVEFFDKFYEEGGRPYRPFAPVASAAGEGGD